MPMPGNKDVPIGGKGLGSGWLVHAFGVALAAAIVVGVVLAVGGGRT